MEQPLVPAFAHDPAQPQRYPGTYRFAGESALGFNLRRAAEALRRYRWMALAIVAAVLAITLVSTLLATPRYTAQASVQINDQGDEVLGKEFEGATTPQTDWDTDRFLNTQLDILRSRGLAERVVDSLDLVNSERFFTAMERAPAGLPTDAKEKRGLAVDLLRANLSVELPRSTRIALIGFTSADAELSARIADSFAEEFIQANLQRRFDSTGYARNFVSEQLEQARTELENSEKMLNDYAKSVGLIRTRDAFVNDSRDAAAGTVTTASLVQLNDAAINARAARIAAQSRWKAVSGVPALSSPTVLANGTVQMLMSKRAELETELASARGRYLPDHPTVTRLENDLAATSRELGRVAATVRESVRSDYIAARDAETQLVDQVDRARGDTLAEQDQSVRYNTLARQADTARSIYDGLLQRYRELNASSGVASSNVAIIDRAEVPTAPSSPRTARNLALGLLVGLALAFLAVFLRDQLDDVIHTPEDVEDKLGLSLLGVIPRSEAGGPLEALGQPRSTVAEAYNSLRGSLLYSSTEGLPKIIVITSAQAEEGKSTTSFAIAQGLARIGRKPLLIDGDLRRPALHRMLGVEGGHGLSDLLTGNAEIGDAVVHAGEGGLDVLPAGPLPPSPTELLSSPRMAQLLEELSARYDTIIIDSPPVLGLADAPLLAAIADGTVFVVEAERGRSGSLKAALRRLRAVEPVLLGAVLTKFDPTKAGNRYSAYYGYDYYQYAGKEEATPA